MLKLKCNNPRSSQPKVGQLYWLKTTKGYIPTGVTSTKAFWGSAVMIHPYRALLSDPSDTTYYPLVESNTLLMPPLMLTKSDFKKGGFLSRISDKKAPKPTPFEKYFFYDHAYDWCQEELCFAPYTLLSNTNTKRLKLDSTERRILYYIHDTNPPQFGEVQTVPEKTYFMTYGEISAKTLEFALEDALAYYGLIDTPRPTHPDFGTNQEEDVLPSETEQTDLPLFHLAEIDGMTTLFAATDAIPQGTARVVERAGYTPNGYFMESLAKYLLHQSGKSTGSIDFDSEAGMFSLIGTATNLQPLKDHLTDLFGDTDELQHVLDQANTAGVEFDG